MRFEPIDLKQAIEITRDLPKTLRVEVAHDLASISKLRNEWVDLEQRSTATLTWFQSFAWCWRWLTMHEDHYERPAVISIREGERLTAVWPLMIQKRFFRMTCLCNLGEPHTQYGGILTETGSLTDAQVTALRQALSAMQGIDMAFFNYVATASPLEQVIPATGEIAVLRNESAYLNLARYKTGADYLAARTKQQRKGRERKRRQLEQHGLLRVRVLNPSDPDYYAYTKLCLHFKAQWLKKTGRMSKGLSFGNHAKFLGELGASSTSTGQPIMFVLELNGKAIAIEIGFLERQHYFSYVASFDGDFAEHSPGKVLMEAAICWLIDKGAKAYDLLANPADYKDSWSDSRVNLRTYCIDYTAIGRLYTRIWAGRARPFVKRTFETLPLDVRVGLLVLGRMELKFLA